MNEPLIVGVPDDFTRVIWKKSTLAHVESQWLAINIIALPVVRSWLAQGLPVLYLVDQPGAVIQRQVMACAGVQSEFTAPVVSQSL